MQKKVRTSLVVALGISLLLVMLNFLGWLRPVRIVVDAIFAPVVRVVGNVGNSVADNVRLFGSLGSIAKQNKDLETQVAELKQQLANVKEISYENDQLRSQLGFSARQNLTLAPARVVGYEPDNVRRFVTIDRGSNSGVKQGMAVISNGVLVGLIENVSTFSSQVFLAADPDFRIRALGQDNRAQGTIKGQIGQGYVMDRIAQNEVIKVGETIITAGSELVPKGIVIGQVESVERSDNAIFQTADVKPAINLNKLEIVFVVTSANK
ncbi:rod shape-determining protein MreC [bacterium]|nr:rod shape-determining protein MreC [bacterium]